MIQLQLLFCLEANEDLIPKNNPSIFPEYAHDGSPQNWPKHHPRIFRFPRIGHLTPGVIMGAVMRINTMKCIMKTLSE